MGEHTTYTTATVYANGDSDSSTGGSSSGGGTMVVKGTEFFGADWTDEEKAAWLESTRRISHLPEYDNYARIPTTIMSKDLVEDIPTGMAFLKIPQFSMSNPTESKLDQLPRGRTSYILEVIKDIDEENVHKVWYPLFEGSYPSMKFFTGTGATLGSSIMPEGEYDPATGEGAYSTEVQAPSMLGGVIGDFTYNRSESDSMQERFGAPTGTTTEALIKDAIDDMVIEILTTTIQYGHTFHKLKEGDLSEDRLSNPIFTDEEEQGVAPAASLSIAQRMDTDPELPGAGGDYD
jgi:hypothetical protein